MRDQRSSFGSNLLILLSALVAAACGDDFTTNAEHCEAGAAGCGPDIGASGAGQAGSTTGAAGSWAGAGAAALLGGAGSDGRIGQAGEAGAVSETGGSGGAPAGGGGDAGGSSAMAGALAGGGGMQGGSSGIAGGGGMQGGSSGIAGGGGMQGGSSGMAGALAGGGGMQGGSSGMAGALAGGGGAGNGSWCTRQSRRANVPEHDYQCVDFDNGLPDSAVWVQSASGTGTVDVSAALASSPPMSLSGSVPSAPDFDGRASAELRWSPVAADPVDSVSLDFELNPASMPGLSLEWTGYVTLACIEVGGGSACLAYTIGSERRFASAYSGLFVRWANVAGAAIADECEVSEMLDFDLWNDVSFGVAMTGDIGVTINGVNATTDCNGGFSADTAPEIALGLSTLHVTNRQFSAHYDNVLATVVRSE